MEDIKVDAKLIIITICISVSIGTVLWLGYNIYTSLTKDADADEDIEYFEGDMSQGIESMGNKENSEIDENFFIEPNPQKKFQINNDNPENGMKNWASVIARHRETGNKYKYSIPSSSVKLRGENIHSGVLDMSSWTEDGTYEQFIEDFIEKIQYQNILVDLEYQTRQINIGGKEYTIIMVEGQGVIFSYFCLAKDGYAYYLEIIVDKNFYDDSLVNTIDSIFSTFTID